ncbi:HAMP domain-containing protein [Salmonella enterica]|nr:HAMP domain-containing protein [Salmonella enterica]
MLKRIKIVTSLLLVLALFGLLQLTSGGLFFNSLKNDKENFTVLQTIRQQQSALNATWVELLQTRNTLNRAGIRWMMDQSNIGSGATVAELMQGATNTLKLTEKNWEQYEALPRDPRQSEAAFLEIKRTYDIYHGALAELIQLLGAGKINEFFDQPTQSYQDAFEKQYMAYMQQNDRLYDIAVEDNNSSYNQAMWVLVSVLIAVLVVIIAVWFGIKLSLIAPMNRLIESIRHIASGDLVKRIDVEGSNEMGQLAENLRHMQSELMRTVGDVRNGANAIYSGASVPWISLDSLISGEGNHYLMRLFGSLTTPEQVAEINNLLLKNFSLRRVIESVTILDTSKVINHVEQFLLRYEHLAGVTVSNERKVALYVHISCLIERLIRHAGITAWSGQQCPEQELNRLREAFSVIESNYSVKIPTAELGYIHNILTFETELIEQDQQF